MKCIIPAAGFGTRMGMKSGQSKEMLKDPVHKHQPIIEYVLALCHLFKLEPIVITRKEKKDLRQYLFNKKVDFIDIEVKGEWNDTILASQSHWTEDNILILPDTRFYSFKVIEDIQRGLNLGNNAVMALHEVTDPTKWGTVKDYHLYEKHPKFTGKHWAWGLIGFKDYYGQELFTNIQCKTLNNVGFTYLQSFEDITRGDKK